MTGTGQYIELPDQDSEPERYYDWMLWRLQKEKQKEANKIYYAIKGQLIPDTWSQKDIDRMLKHYTKRLWGNNERLVYIEERFEKTWKQKYE